MDAVGIVGIGFVGGAALNCFKQHLPVFTYDKKYGLECHYRDSRDAVASEDSWNTLVHACRVIFICLPTPMTLDGKQDLSILEAAIEQLDRVGQGNLVVIKSTVLPGTTDRMNAKVKNLRVAFNPEFLREATALEDFINQDRVVLGARFDVIELEELYRTTNPAATQYCTDPTTAELVKYSTNCFLATKVSFANELAQICEGAGVDYNELIQIATADKRLGTSHWAVPGPMPADDGSGRLLKGFGGSCFVKDINALIHLAEGLGVDPKVMRAAWEKNQEVRPERDWERLKGRAVSS